MKVLIAWSSRETGSWTPNLAAALRADGVITDEVRNIGEARELDLACYDAYLPRFRVADAAMACLDELLCDSGIAQLNSRRCRRWCENKASAHQRFEQFGIRQPQYLVCSAEGVVDRPPSWSGPTIVKPLCGNRAEGIEIFGELESALSAARERREDLLVQRMIESARAWRVVVGRTAGVVDAYWRRPKREGDPIASVTSGASIVRDRVPPDLGPMARAMLDAVDGDVLGIDVMEDWTGCYALEANHNFDAHGGTDEAVLAFRQELEAIHFAPPAPFAA